MELGDFRSRDSRLTLSAHAAYFNRSEALLIADAVQHLLPLARRFAGHP
jgi:hypothetical protein